MGRETGSSGYKDRALRYFPHIKVYLRHQNILIERRSGRGRMHDLRSVFRRPTVELGGGHTDKIERGNYKGGFPVQLRESADINASWLVRTTAVGFTAHRRQVQGDGTYLITGGCTSNPPESESGRTRARGPSKGFLPARVVRGQRSVWWQWSSVISIPTPGGLTG
jgi:hypothetical protein